MICAAAGILFFGEPNRRSQQAFPDVSVIVMIASRPEIAAGRSMCSSRLCRFSPSPFKPQAARMDLRGLCASLRISASFPAWHVR